ncbi:hypothetical protein [Streptomyces barringtoniae]|uniref:hypothetical protein n=1 Tax=Streptomyces barringtoniae TaxID=2892029 RepID=UPI001E49EE5D|nr:hypothetical protein [Streptomyces barringtoniae]MCC5480511.1 hypothetical protein [Streptomyces barringtoniae]
MSLWLDWSLEGVGSAGEEAADVDAAIRALDISVARSRRAFDSDRPWQELKTSADAMKIQILDEGAKVLESGQAWASTIGGVQVKLTPR